MENFNNKILLPHNQVAFQEVMEHFHLNKRAAVVHATGTGKSYIIAAVASQFLGRVIVLAPNYFILEESRKLCTDRIEFRTFASLMNDKSPANDYQLICIDEFHRAGADEWGKGVARLLGANPNAKVLGTTATAIRYLDGQRNMADELFDGNVVSSLPLREAIDRGIIPEPTYVASLYTFDETYDAVKSQIMASNKKSEEEKMKAMRTLDGIAHNWENAHGVSLLMRKYLHKDIKRIVVFCSKVARASKTRDILGPWFAGAGFKHIRFYNIDYKEKRVKEEMDDFQNDDFDGIKVAISVNMLNEGVHVDGVDAVIMMRSTVSPNIILQQIGRCLTAKKTGHKPVIIDLVNNMDTLGILNMWAFSGVKTATGVKEDDASMDKGFPFHIIDECREIRTFLTQIQNEFDVAKDYYPIFWEFVNTHNRLPKYNVVEEKALYAWCGKVWANIDNTTDRLPDVVAKLKEMRWGEKRNINIERKVADFFEFVNTYNRLPKYGVKSEAPLYEWCRTVYSNRYGLADRFPEMLAKLKELRWGETKDIKTERRVNEFWEFVEKNGRLPQRSVKEENSLYEWCRRVWNNNLELRDRLPEVYEKLKELKWGFFYDIQVEKRAKEFWEFVEKNGRLPKQSVKEEKALYAWCGKVFSQYADRLPDVVAKLKELRWGNSYKMLTENKVKTFWEFVNTHNRLPRHSVKEEKPLYQWCVYVWKNQNSIAKKYPDVYAKLKELRFGEDKKNQTEKRVEEFFEFVKIHGRLPKQSVKEETFLNGWYGRVWRNEYGLADRLPDVYAKIKELKEKK